MKKGQVTLFIVLGIIVMIILGFTLFVRDLIFDAKVSESADIIFREYEQASSLNTYLKSCARKVTNNGLTLIGYQGGYIYEDQGGTQERPFTMPNLQVDQRGVSRTYDLAYWIINDTENYGLTIPKLCSNTGPNKLGASEYSVNTCQFLDVYGDTGDNIQDSLANYIDVSLQDCLDLEIYKTTRGNEIIAGQPNSTIIFDKDSFIVAINYPFTIKIRGQEPVIKQVNFTYNAEARLQAAYLFLKLLAEEEAISSSFNPETDFDSLSLYRQGFIVQLVPNWNRVSNDLCTEQCDDDMLWFKDESVIINSKPFEMMIAIQDRAEVDGVDFDDN